MKKISIGFFVLFFLFQAFAAAHSQQTLDVYLFYSKICPHCAAEEEFLEGIEKEYPEIAIHKHDIADPSSRKLLGELLSEYGSEEYLGVVPLTFVGKELFVGFDNDQGLGKEIENAIQRELEGEEFSPEGISLPLIGRINPGEYSFLTLAALLGFLDGFNVCSLGALILILGLVIVLRSKKKILIFGGTFIVTAALIYGILIVLWYKVFSTLAAFLGMMNLLVGLFGIGGGILFFKQFLKFRKYGPMCENEAGKGMIAKLSDKLQRSFREQKGIFFLLAAVFLFAAMITIIEFPCSAVVPVIFAGMLAEAQLSSLGYLFYLGVFVFFYMIDEIIVFLIAVFKMSVWMASGRSVTWITLIEAVVLFSLGVYYLSGFF